jgi:CelD/BcsL family acetyltransferase involved in cellulose biosynthesis
MLKVQAAQINEIGQWKTLQEHSSTATFFQGKEWINLWMKHFGGEAYLLNIYDDEKLIGIAPLLKKNGNITIAGTDRVLGEELVTDFGDIIALKGQEKEVWEEIIKQLKKDGLSHFSFDFIREDSNSFGILNNKGIYKEVIDVAPVLELPATWDEYLLSLDRHNRHEIKRKIRRLEEEQVLKFCHEGDPSDIDEFFRLLSVSTEQKKKFLTYEMKEFFRDTVAQFWKTNQLNLCFMKVNGKNIASALSFVYKDTVLLYNSGFDPEYNRLSAGLTLVVYMIKHAIEQGHKHFDFLRGGEKYKYNLGAKERKLYRFTMNKT